VPKKQKKEVDTSGLSETEALIVSVINDSMSAEEIAGAISAKTGKPMTVGELLGVLTMLEIGGYIEALPGGSFKPI
jgi:hypothetical protein